MTSSFPGCHTLIPLLEYYQVATLKEEFNIDLRVMGIIDSKTMYLDERYVDIHHYVKDVFVGPHHLGIF